MRRSLTLLAGPLAAIALLALPSAAGAAVGGPYRITSPAAGALVVEPVAANGTLVVQAQLNGTDVDFTPAAALPGPCTNDLGGLKTTCPATALASALTFQGGVVEVGAHDITTATLNFLGGPANDIFTLDGASSVTTLLRLDPGAGADAMTVAAAVTNLAPLAGDTGDDRYALNMTSVAAGQTLALGDGADVASNTSPNLTLDGGAGADTLSGMGPLRGDAGDDVLEPKVTDQVADGGLGSDRLSFDLVDTPLAITMTGTTVTVAGPAKTGIERLEGGRAGDFISGSAAADVISGGDGNDTIAGGGGGDTLDGGPGANTVSYAAAAGAVGVDFNSGQITSGGFTDHIANFLGVDTGSGNDSVLGSPADETINVGAGDDTVNAGPGNDHVNGGIGNDLLRGGHGSDVIDGGGGRDTATYDERTVSEPVTVTLATLGDDGAPGENDALVGVEDVIGGASSDALVGDAGPNLLVGGGGLNTLDGGAGNDTLIGGDFRDVIVGGPGSDQLIGGGDDDSLSAFDGEADSVDCGPSTDDDAQVDSADTVVGCEFASRGDVPVPVDADHDGTVAGFDCNDADPTIGLTATDIPGDGIDQNCDGFDEPLGLVTGGFRLTPSRPTARGTRILTLVLTDLPGDSTVVATCKTAVKRRCPFTKVTRKPARAGASVSLSKDLKRTLLPVGTRIEVRVTAPGVIGRVRRFTVRKSAALRAADLCVLPNSSVAKTCPSDVL